MSRSAPLARLLSGALLLLIAVAGCRTYGGYGTSEEIPRQMQQAVQRFADELARAESDVQMLSEAVAQNSALEPLETQYRDVIAKHEEFLERHREIAEQFQDGGDYRALNRNYGAIIAEQRLIETRYIELHARIQRGASGQSATAPRQLRSRYVSNPSFYDRVQNRRGMSMQDALRSL